MTKTWHKPLVWLAAAMVVCSVGTLIGMFVDDRTITGLPLWDKPFKFSVSILIYAVTWAFLIGQLRRFQRLAWWAGTVTAAGLAIEMVIILVQAARDTTSHFNVSSGFNTAMWSSMGATIAFVWVATLVVSVLLFVNPGPDRARNLAVRYGALLAFLGMSLGFLMTIPTKAQMLADNGIAGAHTVGLADGGPGLPILGWSTVGGDLRIPHFVGLHALQAVPLFLLALELLGRRRLPRLADVGARARLVHVAAAGYLGLIALITWQALRGQAIVHPDGWTIAAAAVLVVGVLGSVVVALSVRSTRPVGIGMDRQKDGDGLGVRFDGPRSELLEH